MYNLNKALKLNLHPEVKLYNNNAGPLSDHGFCPKPSLTKALQLLDV